MRIITAFVALLFVAMLNVGCNDGDRLMLININNTKAEEVRKLISNELKVGASSVEIEGFFQRHQVGYSYNKYFKRYKGIIRDVDNSRVVDQDVLIYIYVDEDKLFTSSEVQDIFTAF